MKLLTLFAALILQVFAQHKNLERATILEKTKFLDFAAKFNRHYQSTEDMDSRFGLYLQTKNMIDNAPLSTFKMELNHFADRTDAEKQAALNHYIGQPKEKGRNLQTVCPAGQYLKGNKTCTPCSTAGCKTCPNDRCSQCLSFRMKLNNTTNTCVCQTGPMNSQKTDCTNCTSGTFFDVTSQKCIACRANCTACNATTCTQCKPNFVLQNGTCSCQGKVDISGNCVACSANQFWTGSSCALCSSKTKQCTSCSYTTGQCKSCASPFVLDRDFQCACPWATYLNVTTQKCIGCKANCSACNATTCTQCKTNFTLQNGSCSCSGRVDSAGNCQTGCTADQFWTGSSCAACSSFTKQCTKCSSPTGQCTTCASPFVLARDFTCVCPSGTFMDWATGKCTACSANCTACSANEGCTQCKTNYSLRNGSCSCQGKVDAAGNCTSCSANQFWTGQSCELCSSFTKQCTKCSSPTGQCTTCASPFVLDRNFTCVCPSGTFMDPTNTKCVTCSKYCATCNSAGCTQCLKNYTNQNGTCYCSGRIDSAGNCIPSCTADQFWTGSVCESCLSKTKQCKTCSSPTGKCTSCASPFELQADFTCACPIWGTLFDGEICALLKTCNTTQYNDGANNCVDCGQNCVTCQDVSGKCLTCATGFGVDALNPKDCINCAYPIGPVDSPPVSCVNEPYSSTRLIPPYVATDIDVDWRKWGVVNPIQDQGQCGSCWAFSSTANTESNYAIATGKLFKYSEQYLTSCDNQQYGCEGGWPAYALALIATKGTYLGADYRYTSGSNGLTGTCSIPAGSIVQKPLVGYGSIQPFEMSYKSFKAELQKGVIDVVFDVQDSFYSYASGIYQPTVDCKTSSGSTINHAMVGVGYGVTSDGIEFAIIRNSWGTWWGEKGYSRVALPTTFPGVCALYSNFYRANAGF